MGELSSEAVELEDDEPLDPVLVNVSERNEIKI